MLMESPVIRQQAMPAPLPHSWISHAEVLTALQVCVAVRDKQVHVMSEVVARWMVHSFTSDLDLHCGLTVSKRCNTRGVQTLFTIFTMNYELVR